MLVLLDCLEDAREPGFHFFSQPANFVVSRELKSLDWIQHCDHASTRRVVGIHYDVAR